MSRKTEQKQPGRKALPLNLTLSEVLYEHLHKIVEAHGFNGPSDYVQSRIRLDAGLGLNTHEQQTTREPHH